MSGVNSEGYSDAVFRCQKEKKISHQLEGLGLTWRETFLILMVVNINYWWKWAPGNICARTPLLEKVCPLDQGDRLDKLT